jgi:hypothetical protein
VRREQQFKFRNGGLSPRFAGGSGMSAEKRTVGSEIREFFAEVQEGWRGWRTRASERREIRANVERAQSHAALLATTKSDETEEIVFTPLELEANSTAGTPGAGKTAGASLKAGSICPVTRQIINLKGPIYQCRLCGIYYSPEGWEFLQQTSKGQCCGCRNVKTVFPVVKVR